MFCHISPLLSPPLQSCIGNCEASPFLLSWDQSCQRSPCVVCSGDPRGDTPCSLRETRRGPQRSQRELPSLSPGPPLKFTMKPAAAKWCNQGTTPSLNFVSKTVKMLLQILKNLNFPSVVLEAVIILNT